jgi:hypothetical protein
LLAVLDDAGDLQVAELDLTVGELAHQDNVLRLWTIQKTQINAQNIGLKPKGTVPRKKAPATKQVEIGNHGSSFYFFWKFEESLSIFVFFSSSG